MDAAEVLEKTAEAYLSGKLTWIQDTRHHGLNGACLLGGLAYVATDSRIGCLDESPGRDAWYVLHSEVIGEYGGIAQWNDAPGRTLDDVIDLLHTAAKKLRIADEAV